MEQNDTQVEINWDASHDQGIASWLETQVAQSIHPYTGNDPYLVKLHGTESQMRRKGD